MPMLFYKADVEFMNAGAGPEISERDERACEIQLKTDIFLMEQNLSCQITVSNIIYKKSKAVLCVAAKKEVGAETAERFLRAVGFDAFHIEIQEITLEAYCKMVRIAARHEYIDDFDSFCERVGIASFYNILGNSITRRTIDFTERILSDTDTKKGLLSKSERLLTGDSLQAEIGRIYKGSACEAAVGHPVHYMLMTDDTESRERVLRILLTALYQNGRIQSRRYAEVNANGKTLLAKQYGALYESCAGGTMVLSCSRADEGESEYARMEPNVISGLCDAMRQNRNKTLTVICLERKDEKSKLAFMERLGAITIVPISQETVFCERAKGYLRARAGEYGAKPDRTLYKVIAPGKGYTATDLNLLFDEWYDRRLKTKVYSQYAELETANKQTAAREAKGSAIEELEQMIGLAEAKNVIYQALDFYKAQKLFKAKGFTGERPAMHMAFTGNPGTAKTTAARLFAQIMKDNGLLPVGDLHEVGRADLVGKYVGWTAAIVKEKFTAAKGSVLFIDEAYSLVDDRSGLYGDEAISTIVQEMENHRDDTIVIFAGYPDKMEGFLQKNPGLRSRIAFHVPFADYSADELYRITELMADKKEISLSDSVREKLVPMFEEAMNTEDFGNGRYARNLFEKAIMKQAGRLVSMDADNVTKDDIGTMLAEDFEASNVPRQSMKRIGF
jgi:AAA+ superfamily predicted ATPase